jgi:four helix bundle protein
VEENIKWKINILLMQRVYQDLRIWKYAFELTTKFYEVIAALPVTESHNLADQMRRAATSLPLNVAEGASSQTSKMFISHLKYAYASAKELEVQLMLCFKLKFIDEPHFVQLHDELDRFMKATYKFTVNLERSEQQKRFGFLKEN